MPTVRLVLLKGSHQPPVRMHMGLCLDLTPYYLHLLAYKQITTLCFCIHVDPKLGSKCKVKYRAYSRVVSIKDYFINANIAKF